MKKICGLFRQATEFATQRLQKAADFVVSSTLIVAQTFAVAAVVVCALGALSTVAHATPFKHYTKPKVCGSFLTENDKLDQWISKQKSPPGKFVQDLALEIYGTAYRLGGVTPGKELDCSAFVLFLFESLYKSSALSPDNKKVLQRFLNQKVRTAEDIFYTLEKMNAPPLTAIDLAMGHYSDLAIAAFMDSTGNISHVVIFSKNKNNRSAEMQCPGTTGPNVMDGKQFIQNRGWNIVGLDIGRMMGLLKTNEQAPLPPTKTCSAKQPGGFNK